MKRSPNFKILKNLCGLRLDLHMTPTDDVASETDRSIWEGMFVSSPFVVPSKTQADRGLLDSLSLPFKHFPLIL